MRTEIIRQSATNIDELRKEIDEVNALIEMLGFSGLRVDARLFDKGYEITAGSGEHLPMPSKLMAVMALAPGMAVHLMSHRRDLERKVDEWRKQIEMEMRDS